MKKFNPYHYALALILPAKHKMVIPSCRIMRMPYSMNPGKQYHRVG